MIVIYFAETVVDNKYIICLQTFYFNFKKSMKLYYINIMKKSGNIDLPLSSSTHSFSFFLFDFLFRNRIWIKCDGKVGRYIHIYVNITRHYVKWLMYPDFDLVIETFVFEWVRLFIGIGGQPLLSSMISIYCLVKRSNNRRSFTK